MDLMQAKKIIYGLGMLNIILNSFAPNNNCTEKK